MSSFKSESVFKKGNVNIQEIDLSFNQISSIKNDSFENCRYLKRLILRGNNLKNIERNSFIHMNQLQHIDLSLNIKLKEIDNLFIHLKNLSHLNIAYTDMRNLSNQLFSFDSQLEHLDLSFNQLELVEANLTNIRKLKSMKLGNINKTWVQHINFDIFEQLEEIDLNNTNLDKLPQSILKDSIKKINLNYNPLENIDLIFEKNNLNFAALLI